MELACFGPCVTFGFELGLEFRFGLELGFDLEFGFGDGKIDHEAESVGKLPCRYATRAVPTTRRFSPGKSPGGAAEAGCGSASDPPPVSAGRSGNDTVVRGP